MAGGRPSKYTPELQEKADDYADNFAVYGHEFPSVVGLCKELKINTDTAYSWVKDESKSQFSDTLKTIADRQHFELLNRGIVGDFTAPITKLVLHNHGYSDKAKSELSGPNDSPIQIDQDIVFKIVDPQ